MGEYNFNLILSNLQNRMKSSVTLNENLGYSINVKYSSITLKLDNGGYSKFTMCIQISKICGHPPTNKSIFFSIQEHFYKILYNINLPTNK